MFSKKYAEIPARLGVAARAPAAPPGPYFCAVLWRVAPRRARRARNFPAALAL